MRGNGRGIVCRKGYARIGSSRSRGFLTSLNEMKSFDTNRNKAKITPKIPATPLHNHGLAPPTSIGKTIIGK
jgi:hypothetical protein